MEQTEASAGIVQALPVLDTNKNLEGSSRGMKRDTSAESFVRNEEGSQGYMSRGLKWYATESHNRPWTISCSLFFLIIVITGIVGGSGMFAITPENGKSWFPLGSIETKRMDAYEKAVDSLSAGFDSPERSVNENLYTMHFFYKASNGNMLSPANLQVVLDTEAFLADDEEYKTSFCYLGYSDGATTKCVEPISWINQLEDGGVLDDAKVDVAIAKVKGSSLESTLTSAGFKDTDQSEYTRSQYFFGGPVKNFTTTSDPDGDQRDVVIVMQERIQDNLVEFFGLKATWALDSKFRDKAIKDTADGQVEVLWMSTILNESELDRIVGGDFLWALFCICAVWIYMSIHLQSLLLASVGMFEIIMAFPVAFFFYRGLFQVSYFQNLQIMTVFVMLGIGADDVFVFVDAFKQAKQAGLSTSLERVIFASDRASKAIFATSLTTAGAFAATTTSSVMPIAAFGIFACVLILMLFLFNVLILPPVLVLYDRYFGELPCCVCTTACLESQACQKSCCKKPEEGAKPIRRVEAFFNGPFSDAVVYSPARFSIVAVFFVIFIVGLIFAIDLKPPEEQTGWFPDGHMITRALDWQITKFDSADSDQASEVVITWGVKGISRSGVDWWDPDDRGKIMWDDTFDLADEKAQDHIVKVCAKLRTASCDAKLCEPQKTLARNGEVLCVMEAFSDWIKVEYPLIGFPVMERKVFLEKLLQFTNLTETKSNYANLVGFVAEVGCTANTCVTAPAGNMFNLKFLTVKANGTFSETQSHSLAIPCASQWDDFLDDQNDIAPASVNNAWQFSYTWVWAQTQEALVEIVINGMGITFSLAFVVLIFATGNVILALISIFTIAGIVVSVLGIGCRLIQGWSLDITESIAAVILIGFSVDYCVHLAHAYMESSVKTRQARIQDALTTMGISVTAGALTTFMAGVFLFGAVMPFFQKFGFIIVFTIFSSYLWAMLFFPAACSIVGPENTFGDVKTIWARAKKSFAGPTAYAV